MRLLLCDDSAAYRAALRAVFATDPAIEVVGEAASGDEAVLRARELRPDVVLMDVGLPRLNGIEATRLIAGELPRVRVIGLTAHGASSVVIPLIEAGARGVCLKGGTFDDLHRAVLGSETSAYLDERALGTTLQEIARLHRHQQELAASLQDATARLEEASDQQQLLSRGIVAALAAAIETRDGYTGGHAARVTQSALLLTAKIAPELADDPVVEYGYLLHDIGKLGVPDSILNKPGPLSDPERALMNRHVEFGVKLLGHIPRFERALEIVANHHERWDGKGYPHGRVREEIPISARIFSVCDAYDAITSDRPYRRGLPPANAPTLIAADAGSQFDPAITEAFIDLLETIELAERRR